MSQFGTHSPRGHHSFVPSPDPKFGAYFGGACGYRWDGTPCGWPRSAHAGQPPYISPFPKPQIPFAGIGPAIQRAVTGFADAFRHAHFTFGNQVSAWNRLTTQIRIGQAQDAVQRAHRITDGPARHRAVKTARDDLRRARAYELNRRGWQ